MIDFDLTGDIDESVVILNDENTYFYFQTNIQ